MNVKRLILIQRDPPKLPLVSGFPAAITERRSWWTVCLSLPLSFGHHGVPNAIGLSTASWSFRLELAVLLDRLGRSGGVLLDPMAEESEARGENAYVRGNHI